jgi:hypothetical protein
MASAWTSLLPIQAKSESAKKFGQIIRKATPVSFSTLYEVKFSTLLDVLARGMRALASLAGTGLIHHRCGNDAAPVHWHSQRMGCRDLHGLRTLPAAG